MLKLLMAALFLFGGAAWAEKPDLAGAELIAQGNCDVDDEGEDIPCVLVQKGEERYLLLVDQYNVIFVAYRIRKGAYPPFETYDRILIWSDVTKTS